VSAWPLDHDHDSGGVMRILAWLRWWIGTTLALGGVIAVVVKISSVAHLPVVIEKVVDVVRAPGEWAIGTIGCGAHGGECFALPWLLVFCLLSGAAWATVLTVVTWALGKIRGK
jgi:hypothetical protein